MSFYKSHCLRFQLLFNHVYAALMNPHLRDPVQGQPEEMTNDSPVRGLYQQVVFTWDRYICWVLTLSHSSFIFRLMGYYDFSGFNMSFILSLFLPHCRGSCAFLCLPFCVYM